MKLRLSATWRRACLACFGAVALGCGSTADYLGYDRTGLRPLACPTPYRGAYRDVLGQTQAKIDERLEQAFQQLFHGDPNNESIYLPTGPEQAVIRDSLHNQEVRTEGMGLGMIASVLMNRRDEFDRLWRYASANLAYTSGQQQGYFRSRCDWFQLVPPTGVSPSRDCADPYGLQQFVMALLLARQRWGKIPGAPNYESDAERLFQLMRGRLPIGEINGAGGATSAGAGGASSGGNGAAGTGLVSPAAGAAGSSTGGAASADGSGAAGAASNVSATALPTFDAVSKLVFDEPVAVPLRMTGTSLEMPGYYSVWAQVTGDPFYAEAAQQARSFLQKVAHPNTGLLPVRAWFDATPFDGWGDFSAEAYRALLNLAIDRIWGTNDPWQTPQINALLKFFQGQGMDSYGATYTLDGKPTSIPNALHLDELVLVNGVIAALSDLPEKREFVQAAWNVPVPAGQSRYYPGLLYLMSNLILGGRFQLCP